MGSYAQLRTVVAKRLDHRYRFSAKHFVRLYLAVPLRGFSGAGPFGLVAKYTNSINTVVGDRMAISSFKGVNQILDVVSGLASVEATTVYPRGVLLVTSSGSLRLGDGTTAGGAAVGTESSVAFADVTGKPTTLAGYGITDALANPLSTDLNIADGKGFGSSAANAGKLIPTAGSGYNGPSSSDLVLGSAHGVGVFLDPGNDDSGSAFTIWSNINPYVGTPTEDNYKLKLNGDTGNLGIAGRVTAIGGFRGDLTGSVFGDDSTTIVDSVNNRVTSTLVANAGVAPTTNSPGEVGEIRFDDNYIYVRTAGAGWKRANLSGIA